MLHVLTLLVFENSLTGSPSHFHVISNDEKHDHHFTHYVQNQIAEYLRSISCDVDVMHEFCGNNM
jgi:hypothetical protein